MSSYPVIKDDVQIEIEVKRSRFIAFAIRVSGNEHAKQALHTLRERYPDASHHCYAFVSGAPSNSQGYGCSDDGEPSGTAGKPIFARVHHSGIGELLIVVVRYFGGTKLGTGGLVRAYGDAATAVMEQIETQEYVEQKELEITVPYNREGDVRRAIEKLEGEIIDVAYAEQATIKLRIPHDASLPSFY